MIQTMVLLLQVLPVCEASEAGLDKSSVLGQSLVLNSGSAQPCLATFREFQGHLFLVVAIVPVVVLVVVLVLVIGIVLVLVLALVLVVVIFFFLLLCILWFFLIFLFLF